MAKTGNEKLAEALAVAGKAAVGNIINSMSIGDRQRTLLISQGYLKLIIKGWYLLDADLMTRNAGESALWYESIWSFIGQYVSNKVDNNYWLSPEASLDLHTGSNLLAKQLIVYVENFTSITANLPNGMSLLLLGSTKKPYKLMTVKGLNAHSLESALVECAPKLFKFNPLSTQLALQMADPTTLHEAILTTKNISSGNRLIGGFLALGMKTQSRNLQTVLEGAGFSNIKGLNPFTIIPPKIGMKRGESPSSIRVRLLWQQMRQTVIDVFADFLAPYDFHQRDFKHTQAMVSELYVSDAYNSLSIEGYRVTPELIERVSGGDWSPETQVPDKQHKDALAARGYFDAYNKLSALLKEAHDDKGEPDFEYFVGVGLTQWYTALFQPCVTAGIIDGTALVGYRKGPVYIRKSMHVPPASEQLMDCIDALKELIVSEPNYAVRAVLGHLFMGYIHPFPDGNGRTARFLMNFLLVMGGYPWAVIKLENRDQYLNALESASAGNNVKPFAEFIKQSIEPFEG
jgi:Fic family protein